MWSPVDLLNKHEQLLREELGEGVGGKLWSESG